MRKMAILHGDALSYFGVAGTIPKCQPLLSFRLRPKEGIMVPIVIGALLFIPFS